MMRRQAFPATHAARWALVAALLLMACSGAPARAARRDLGRETLWPNDGWASIGKGTTGGAAAANDRVYTVRTRRELIAALNNGAYPPPSSTPSDDPKVIYVDGEIDANADDAGAPLRCSDYVRDGYTLEGYLAKYDPAVWSGVPSGPLEQARVASADAQQARIRVRVGSNTTLVGLDSGAVIKGAWFDIRGAGRTNIIIRNIRFEDTYDCFPQWDPTDGSTGNWNSRYDAISIRDGDHIWIDHNDFADVATPDGKLPTYFGRLWQVHDGLVDITNAANYVTVSYNRFRDHDKTMLIGSSDTAFTDRGTLKVSVHHNLFEGVGQRAPRVRFGQVHVFNNLYVVRPGQPYGASWGVGTESAIYAEQNVFSTESTVKPSQFITVSRGTAITTLGNWHQGSSGGQAVDVRAEWNAANDPDLGADVGWKPTLYRRVDRTTAVPGWVERGAGPFDW